MRATRTKGGRRQLRLFACGCCRLIWVASGMISGCGRQSKSANYGMRMSSANKAGIAHREESASMGRLSSLRQPTSGAAIASPHGKVMSVLRRQLVVAAGPLDETAFDGGVLCMTSCCATYLSAGILPRFRRLEANAALICRPLLRDIFSGTSLPPGRLLARAGAHRTPRHCPRVADVGTHVRIVRVVCHAMPILADALQDAGCDNDHILSHCRDANQIHVRGCWVVDLVLGKGFGRYDDACGGRNSTAAAISHQSRPSHASNTTNSAARVTSTASESNSSAGRSSR